MILCYLFHSWNELFTKQKKNHYFFSNQKSRESVIIGWFGRCQFVKFVEQVWNLIALLRIFHAFLQDKMKKKKKEFYAHRWIQSSTETKINKNNNQQPKLNWINPIRWKAHYWRNTTVFIVVYLYFVLFFFSLIFSFFFSLQYMCTLLRSNTDQKL